MCDVLSTYVHVSVYVHIYVYGTCCKLVPDFRHLPRTGANGGCSLPHGDLRIAIYAGCGCTYVML